MRKHFKKLNLFLLFAIVVILIVPQKTYANPTSSEISENIPSKWALLEIDKAKEWDLIPERIQGRYTTGITREEFSELAVRLYEALSDEECEAEYNNAFNDTQNAKVAIAYQLGIVNGTGDRMFAPNNTATREEVIVIFYRTLKAAKPDYNLSIQNDYIFADQNEISLWAQEAVGYLYASGIVGGVGENRFNPGGITSYEEAIVLVKRMYEKYSVPEGGKRDTRNDAVASRSDSRSQTLDELRELISKEMGKPYKWGGTGPDSYDCSGLVYSLFGKLGISLPRVAASQATVGTYVAKEDLTYGDLVFFARDGKNINHVGIYVGGGEFVHSPQTGDVVRNTTLMSGYYGRTYYTARRVIR